MAIPHEMMRFAQWVCWRYETVDGALTKVPYKPGTAQRASVTDPTTWTSATDVMRLFNPEWYSGIGFVLTNDDPYCFIDLDGTTDKDILARQQFIFETMNSYTEWSPSGVGRHVLVKGAVPSGVKRDKIELYSSLRYMTMTGNTLLDAPIAARESLVLDLYNSMSRPKTLVKVVDSPETHTDAEVWEMMMSAHNGENALSIWNNESHGTRGDGSPSAGDMALIDIIQFYTKNIAQIERIFKAAPRCERFRTGAKRKHKNYIRDMIHKAFDRELPDIDFSAIDNAAMIKFVPPPPPSIGRPSIEQRLAKLPAPKQVSQADFPPGLVGDIARFIYAQSAKPVPEVSLAGALTFMSGIVGRNYNVYGGSLNQYILMLAPTGTGKEAVRAGINTLMKEILKVVPAAENYRGPSDIASGPALGKFMAEFPCCFTIMGEFGKRLATLAGPDAPDHQRTLEALLLELYNSGEKQQIAPKVYSQKNNNVGMLVSPSFTLFGESTAETFYEVINESMVDSGLLPRFLIMEYGGEAPYLSRDFMHVKPSSDLISKIAELFGHVINMSNAQLGVRYLPVVLDQEAETLSWQLADYYTDLVRNREGKVAAQLYNRSHVKILRMAGVVAVGIRPQQPVITKDLLLWAQQFVDAGNDRMIAKFNSGEVGTRTNDHVQIASMRRILARYQRSSWEMLPNKVSTLEPLHLAHVVPYKWIQNTCVALKEFKNDHRNATFAIKMALATLVETGEIVEVKPHQLRSQFDQSGRAYFIPE